MAAASAIKVFPLLVGAETTTDEPLKNASIAILFKTKDKINVLFFKKEKRLQKKENIKIKEPEIYQCENRIYQQGHQRQSFPRRIP